MAKEFKATIKNKKQANNYFNRVLPDSTRFALAGTANVVAFEGLKKSNQQFKKEFVLSNKYLIGSAPGKGVLKFTKSKPHHDLNKIESSWGVPPKRGATDLDFLVDQETGFKHDGMVPTKHAYPSQNKNKVIKRALRRSGITIKGTRGFPRGIAPTNAMRTVFFIRQMKLNNFAQSGSKQYIYLKPEDQFFNFREGMYQFTTQGRLKMIYAKHDSVNKKRNPTDWMDKSSKAFTQTEIDNIYEKELNKSLTQAFKKL
jgi:hypothetical protein